MSDTAGGRPWPYGGSKMTIKSNWAAEFEQLNEFAWRRVQVVGLPPMYVCYGKTVDGRPVVTGLLLSPETNQEIRAKTLRQVPLSFLLEAMSTAHSFDAVIGGPTPQDSSEPYSPPRVKPGRKGWPREHFERVADAYRHAQRTHPGAPIKALKRQLNASEPTVHRWLQRCRDMGLLPQPAREREEGTPS